MTIATIQIPEKKTALVKQLLKELGVTITISNEKSPYDAEFVKKIKKADEDIKHGRTKKIAITDIWK